MMATDLAAVGGFAEQHARWIGARSRLWGRASPVERITRPTAPRPASKLVVLPVLKDPFGWPLYLKPVFYDHFDSVQIEPPKKTLKQIALEVASKHSVSLIDLKSARRDRPTATARQEAFYRMRTETERSLPEIGRFFNRDHTTALHGIKMHAQRMAEAS